MLFVQTWAALFFINAQTTMEKHIAIYAINSESLTQTIALLYEVYQRTGQKPAAVTAAGQSYSFNTSLALKLVTGSIRESDYKRVCKT